LLNYQYRAAVWAASLLFLATTAALMSREESGRFSTTKYDPRRAGWKSRLLGTARNLLLLRFVRAGHAAGEAIPSAWAVDKRALRRVIPGTGAWRTLAGGRCRVPGAWKTHHLATCGD